MAVTIKINQPVSVNFYFESKNKISIPKVIIWNNRSYSITKIGLHHTYRQGTTLFHVYSVLSGNTFMRLLFNTENLHWTLEEVADGLPS